MVDGTPFPNNFFSKNVTELQYKYLTFHYEFLAAYSSVLNFKSFLEGRDITLCSDYKPLFAPFYNRSSAKSNSLQLILTISGEYIYSIVHMKGSDNSLSTLWIQWTSPYIALLQETDQELPALLDRKFFLFVREPFCVVWSFNIFPVSFCVSSPV